MPVINPVQLQASNIIGTLGVAQGGTGEASASGARSNLGLGTVATLSSVSLATDTTGTLAILGGGTGKSNIADAAINLQIGQTFANVGTGGTGIYLRKVDSTIELKKISAGSGKATVADGGNDTVAIDVSEANLTLNNIGGSLSLVAKSGLLPLATGTSGSLSLVTQSGLLPLGTGVSGSLALVANSGLLPLGTGVSGSLALIANSGLLPLGTGVSGSLSLLTNSGQLPGATGISGLVATASLGTGTETATKFLKGDQTWGTPSSSSVAAADVTGSISLLTQSGQLRLADGVTGTLSVGSGGTGASSGGAAYTNLGLMATSNLSGSIALVAQSGLLPLGTGVSGSLALVANSGLLPLATGTTGSLSLVTQSGLLPLGTGVSGSLALIAFSGLLPLATGTTGSLALLTSSGPLPLGTTVATGTTGTLSVASGGTGAANGPAAYNSLGSISLVAQSGLLPLVRGTSGTLAIVSGGTGASNVTVAFNALSPTTTKGDIIVQNGTDDIRLAVGANDEQLTADSTTASGLKWAAAGGAGGGLNVTRVAGNSGAANTAASPSETWQILTANATANSTTTLTAVMTTTGLAIGTYYFEYHVIWQSATATVGTNFSVDYGGTVTRVRAFRHYQTTGAAAATGVSDGVSTTLTGQLVEHMSTRTDNGSLGPNTGVDTINADQYDVIKGIVVVSTSASLVLNHASETATSTQVMADTWLRLVRLA